MSMITILNRKTGKTIRRNVDIADYIDGDGYQYSQAVSRDGLVARCSRDEYGELYWFLV